MKHFHLPEADSSNSYMAAHTNQFDHCDFLTLHAQTAGRGQRGNHWEAEPGANVTMSVMIRPDRLPVSNVFLVSEAAAIAVANVAQQLLGPAMRVEIKWPNDIYVNQFKIAGILIENSITASGVDRCIAGIGLNVNQQVFLSDAPNPRSVFQLSGRRHDVADVARMIAVELQFRIFDLTANPDELQRRYRSLLWRGTGVHTFIDPLTDSRFMAEIVDVAPSGHITLRHSPSGLEQAYAFKELVWPIFYE